VVYQPTQCLRVELDLKAYGDLAEWRLIRGGSQRGGMSIAHGCWWPTPEDCDEAITRIMEEIREQLFEVVAGFYPIQLRFE